MSPSHQSSHQSIKDKESYFLHIAKRFCSLLAPEEALSASLAAEESLFIRFNHSKVRQSTQVEQANLTLEFIINKREIKKEIPLRWITEADEKQFAEMLNEARVESKILPESQFIVYPQNLGSSSINHWGQPLEPSDVISQILKPVREVDFAGLLVSGFVIQANFNSEGQSHWFSTENFYVDYSLYSEKQKAVKSCYAAQEWDQNTYEQNINDSIQQLRQLDLPLQKISAGNHRTYFAPAAVDELLAVMSLDGFSGAAYKQGFCALKSLFDKEQSFSELLTLSEDFSLGLSPRFNDKGETAVEQLPLVDKGIGKNLLINSRTSKEYELKSNAANSWEHPRSLTMATGSLQRSDILSKLDTGLYISNLHYLNWSDQPKARVTGMTRFACFWVEEGKVKGPIQDLRFDETLFKAFGSNLLGVTAFSEVQPTISTYYNRSIGGRRVPGILVSDFSYTL